MNAKSLTPIHKIAKSEYCVIRVNHSSTALIPGLSSQYVSFEIVKASSVNKAGVVTKVETEAGWTESKWAYLYSITEWQAEAAELWKREDTTYDNLSSIKAALTQAKESLIDAEVHRNEMATERALGIL